MFNYRNQSTSATYDDVRNAINGKQQVIASFKGYYRELCPHVIGWSKTGVEQCLFYQFGGESSSGRIIPRSPKNWRCIPLSRLEIIEVKDGDWHTASNHSRRQSCVNQIDVEVDFH